MKFGVLKKHLIPGFNIEEPSGKPSQWLLMTAKIVKGKVVRIDKLTHCKNEDNGTSLFKRDINHEGHYYQVNNLSKKDRMYLRKLFKPAFSNETSKLCGFYSKNSINLLVTINWDTHHIFLLKETINQ